MTTPATKSKPLSDSPSAAPLSSKSSPSSKSNKTVLELIILLVIILIIGIVVLLSPLSPFASSSPSKFSFLLPSKESSAPSPSPLPTPRPIPHGEIGFSVGQSDKTVPQFGKGSLNPYDPELNSTQTISVAVKFESPISSVTATVTTDNQTSDPIPLSLVSGTYQDGTWQGSWVVTDSYLFTYSLVLEANSQDHRQNSTEITLR